MNPDVVDFAQVAVIIVGLVGSLTTIGLVAFKLAVRSKGRPLEIARDESERLERLQQSVDAIAIEVERIAEAQRFSVKLLAERTAGDVVGR